MRTTFKIQNLSWITGLNPVSGKPHDL